jgi:hypothetical protein
MLSAVSAAAALTNSSAAEPSTSYNSSSSSSSSSSSYIIPSSKPKGIKVDERDGAPLSSSASSSILLKLSKSQEFLKRRMSLTTSLTPPTSPHEDVVIDLSADPWERTPSDARTPLLVDTMDVDVNVNGKEGDNNFPKGATRTTASTTTKVITSQLAGVASPTTNKPSEFFDVPLCDGSNCIVEYIIQFGKWTTTNT